MKPLTRALLVKTTRRTEAFDRRGSGEGYRFSHPEEIQGRAQE